MNNLEETEERIGRMKERIKILGWLIRRCPADPGDAIHLSVLQREECLRKTLAEAIKELKLLTEGEVRDHLEGICLRRIM